MSFTIPERQD